MRNIELVPRIQRRRPTKACSLRYRAYVCAARHLCFFEKRAKKARAVPIKNSVSGWLQTLLRFYQCVPVCVCANRLFAGFLLIIGAVQERERACVRACDCKEATGKEEAKIIIYNQKLKLTDHFYSDLYYPKTSNRSDCERSLFLGIILSFQKALKTHTSGLQI